MIPVESISLTITQKGSIYRIELKASDKVVEHSSREKQLVLAYLRSDAILTRKLLRGQVLFKEIDSNRLSDDKIAELIRPYVIDRKIADSLYPYQRAGVAWLLRRPRCLLADDMGLGKTYQAISAMRRLIRYGRIEWALIVVPKSLSSNWHEELKRWAPELKVQNVNRRELVDSSGWLKLIHGNHILITTYDVLRGDIQKIIENPPDLIIADEAHRLRKKESLTFRCFRLIKSKFLWALTGTPIERSTDDLSVIMSLIEPRQFAMTEASASRASLQARARPYVLRRSKSDVLSQLPPVIERLEAIELSNGQRKAYDAISRSSVFPNQLARFSALREICDFDRISGESSKLERILELILDISDSNEKVVVFSYTIEPITILANKLSEHGIAIKLLIGSQTTDERSAVLSEFKNNSNTVALLASTKIAAEGLTLTEANHIIFINKWWNPSSNMQARDRVVRIGQRKTVQVVSFKTLRTLEESLERILQNKQETFDKVLSALSNAEINVDGEFNF